MGKYVMARKLSGYNKVTLAAEKGKESSHSAHANGIGIE
jgi:hypothetical protein